MTEGTEAAGLTEATGVTEATYAGGCTMAGATEADALRLSSSMKCVYEGRTEENRIQLYYNSEENNIIIIKLIY